MIRIIVINTINTVEKDRTNNACMLKYFLSSKSLIKFVPAVICKYKNILGFKLNKSLIGHQSPDK